MIRVLLADDQPLMRGGFRALIDAEDDMTVVAEAADGPTAARLAGEYRPDVALLDVEMPGGDGISAVRDRAGLVVFAYESGLVQPKGAA
jgi:YesN/AraC family two-component response regulator